MRTVASQGTPGLRKQPGSRPQPMMVEGIQERDGAEKGTITSSPKVEIPGDLQFDNGESAKTRILEISKNAGVRPFRSDEAIVLSVSRF